MMNLYLNEYSDFYSMELMGLNGRPIKRMPEDYPYSYDTFILWKTDECIEEKSQTTVYSDRLFSWDSKKFSKAYESVWGKTSPYFYDKSIEDIKKFLGLYLKKEIRLTLVAQGCNHSTGEPFWMFNYK